MRIRDPENPWSSRVIIVILLPDIDEQIRNATSVVHRSETLPADLEADSIRMLIRWAQNDHSPHPKLPSYAGRSYLRESIDSAAPIDEIKQALSAQDCKIMIEVFPNFVWRDE